MGDLGKKVHVIVVSNMMLIFEYNICVRSVLALDRIIVSIKHKYII